MSKIIIHQGWAEKDDHLLSGMLLRCMFFGNIRQIYFFSRKQGDITIFFKITEEKTVGIHF